MGLLSLSTYQQTVPHIPYMLSLKVAFKICNSLHLCRKQSFMVYNFHVVVSYQCSEISVLGIFWISGSEMPNQQPWSQLFQFWRVTHNLVFTSFFLPKNQCTLIGLTFLLTRDSLSSSPPISQYCPSPRRKKNGSSQNQTTKRVLSSLPWLLYTPVPRSPTPHRLGPGTHLGASSCPPTPQGFFLWAHLSMPIAHALAWCTVCC